LRWFGLPCFENKNLAQYTCAILHWQFPFFVPNTKAIFYVFML